MKRLSRHTVVVLLILVTSSLGGMSLAVVAFGQSTGDPDATVPLGDYTATTPGTQTQPVSGYTQPLSTYTSTTPTVQTQPAKPTTPSATSPTPESPTTGNGRPSRAHGSTGVPAGGADLPSRATRSGPTHLAFTGGEPLLIGAFGIMLMALGVVLHRRRSAGRPS